MCGTQSRMGPLQIRSSVDTAAAKGLYTLVSENGNFVIPKQSKLLPKTATKSPVSGYKVAVFGNKCGQAVTS